jgi:hypothetical protein
MSNQIGKEPFIDYVDFDTSLKKTIDWMINDTNR